VTKSNKLRLSISFREEYKHVYEHLSKQANRSDYICRMINKELESEETIQRLEDKLEKLLNAISKGQALVIADMKQTDSNIQAEQELREDDIDLINNLF
jgi:ABC-type Fe3+-citrate transport system substrate-binding protein